MVRIAPWPSPAPGIRAWMAWVSLAASLPMLLLLLAVTAWNLRQLEHQRRESLQRVAARTASLVQAEVDLKLVQLRTVSVGVGASQRLFDRLHEVLHALARADRDIESFSVVNADGRRFVDSRIPPGQPLPPSGVPELDRQALAGGRPVVSPLLKGSVSGKAVIGLAVPVPAQPGLEALLLRMSVDAAVLSRLLQRQPLPADWVVGVIDQNGAVLARNRMPEQVVGLPASESVRALVATGGAQVQHTLTRDGRAALAAVAPVGDTGWFVAVGVPEDAIDQAQGQVLGTVLLLGAALAAASLGVSLWTGRRVAAAVQALAARQGGDGGLRIPELSMIRQHFDAHDAAERGHAQQLQSARHDALTGLPARGLFLEQAEARLRVLPAGERLGLLYIDLDGFKALNDRAGHEAGDRALQQVAVQLRLVLRPQDLAGRLGGDEFVVAVVAPAAQVEAACTRVAQSLLAAVPEAVPGLGCSIGVAAAEPGAALAEALHRADQAMLASKRAGKGRVTSG